MQPQESINDYCISINKYDPTTKNDFLINYQILLNVSIQYLISTLILYNHLRIH